MHGSNGDTDKVFKVDGDDVVGIGSYHKTLPHNEYGEVTWEAFDGLKKATRGDGSGFADVDKGPPRPPNPDTYTLTNPQAGLAADRLIRHPASYSMPPAPHVLSESTAAEMTELYWMAVLRDVPLSELNVEPQIANVVGELNACFGKGLADHGDPGRVRAGVDLPGSDGAFAPFTADTLFRLGLEGEAVGPMVSQFFLRPAQYGAQSIDARINPYKTGSNYLTDFDDWLKCQDSGRDRDGLAYNGANEASLGQYETVTEADDNLKLAETRYISTMRDLARFVNKDALHQAYFNAALILLSGMAKWTEGNPYGDWGPLKDREAGFGVLGGPHILSLVSEVATRALKAVWNQKWQVHLRLRPEAYGGLVYVQNQGVNGTKRGYGLPRWVAETAAADAVAKLSGGGPYLLPMAFSPGSPSHPAYGAGHATVAGACVTVLKAWFQTFTTDKAGVDHPILFKTLKEPAGPFGAKPDIATLQPGTPATGWKPTPLEAGISDMLTIEGELNKLAQNVAMGRSMGGVHWRTDNTRSLVLGEALAAEILADITTDCNERPIFQFRTFARGVNGEPHRVRIVRGRIEVDGKPGYTHGGALTS